MFYVQIFEFPLPSFLFISPSTLSLFLPLCPSLSILIWDSLSDYTYQFVFFFFLYVWNQDLNIFTYRNNKHSWPLICMTKVLVLGSTLFGKVKIPSCIACDRPLLEKVLTSERLFLLFSLIKTKDWIKTNLLKSLN